MIQTSSNGVGWSKTCVGAYMVWRFRPMQWLGWGVNNFDLVLIVQGEIRSFERDAKRKRKGKKENKI